MYREDTGGDGEGVTLDTAPCYDADKHIHRLTLTAYEVFLLKHGKRIDKNTGVARGKRILHIMLSVYVWHVSNVPCV